MARKAKNQLVTRYSDGTQDFYFGSRAITAGYKVTLPSGTVLMGHNMTLELAASTGRQAAMDHSGLHALPGASSATKAKMKAQREEWFKGVKIETVAAENYTLAEYAQYLKAKRDALEQPAAEERTGAQAESDQLQGDQMRSAQAIAGDLDPRIGVLCRNGEPVYYLNGTNMKEYREFSDVAQVKVAIGVLDAGGSIKCGICLPDYVNQDKAICPKHSNAAADYAARNQESLRNALDAMWQDAREEWEEKVEEAREPAAIEDLAFSDEGMLNAQPKPTITGVHAFKASDAQDPIGCAYCSYDAGAQIHDWLGDLTDEPATTVDAQDLADKLIDWMRLPNPKAMTNLEVVQEIERWKDADPTSRGGRRRLLLEREIERRMMATSN